MAAHHPAVMHEVHPVLDPGQAVGDLAEVAHAHVLLAVEVERAVVGADHLEIVVDQALPQLRRVIRGAQGR